jgi:hypothetical protein
MLIINSFLVVPHNLIHKCKHALINKGFKVFISKKNQHKNITKYKRKYKKKKKDFASLFPTHAACAWGYKLFQAK